MAEQWTPARIGADLAACLGFFTRLPAGRFGFGEVNFADALWAAPVAGAVVGVAAGTAFAIAAWLGLPPTLAALVALAAAILVTGSLHEDGVADIADGFGGGNTRERKLEIMKDSRNGTFGVVALVMVLLARWAAISAVGGSGNAVLALVAAHAASRALLPGFMQMVEAGAPRRPVGRYRPDFRQRLACRGRVGLPGVAAARAVRGDRRRRLPGGAVRGHEMADREPDRRPDRRRRRRAAAGRRDRRAVCRRFAFFTLRGSDR